MGTKTGYKLFSLTTVEKLDCIHESGQYGALIIHVYQIITFQLNSYVPSCTLGAISTLDLCSHVSC